MKPSFLTAENPICRSVEIDFGIKGDSVDPETITNDIGISPDLSWAKGTSYKSRTKDGFQNLKKTSGIWSISTKKHSKSTSVEKHAEALLALLKGHEDVIESYLQKKDLTVSIRITWNSKDSVGGYDLSSETLQKLCSLCQFFYFTNLHEE